MTAGRRWTFILVPPDPGARTRRLSVGARALKSAAITVAAGIAAAGLWAAADSAAVVATSDQLATARQMVLQLHDSVHVLEERVLADAALVDSAPEMIMPVDGQVTSRFSRSRLHPLLQIFRPHRGIDLSAPAGTKIVATAVGTVTFVGWRLGDGLTVELSHNGGVMTRYAHCRTTLVHVGQRVPAGAPIATVGSSGIATGPHVHFEVLVRGTPVDPLEYLAASHDSATAVAERLRGEDR
ncbi:MAG TPA: M23 family metallopeptidase [Gemmatimonadaceae bacterium]|nr:M23 family metallopeptidase [Gemmatimonadaceae bacterium]